MRQSPANRILLLLKTEGPQPIFRIGAHLAVSSEAARQQLAKLAEDGLAQPVTQSGRGRGRPMQVWELTPQGHRRFPDGHAELTAGLLSSIAQTLGDDALERVIAARETDTLARYRREMVAGSLADRVRQLAAIRSREGYMADCWQEEDGSITLVENHCPICAAAAACAGFCRSELETFRLVLDAKVDRYDHILLGARRCAYRISSAAAGGLCENPSP